MSIYSIALLTWWLGVLEGIKAISFDVDDTLWDFDSIMQSALSAVVEELNLRGLNLDFRITVDSLDVTWQNLRDHRKGQITDLVQLRKDSITAALKQIGITDCLLTTELTDLYFRVRHENNLPFKDVLPALNVLKEHFTLGTLTNGNTRPASLGIDGIFDFQVLSVEHGGMEKPDPRIFQIAVAEAGCQPNELLHVGDHLEYDVLGALRSGVRSAWVNRRAVYPSINVTPDIEVATIQELADLHLRNLVN